MIVIICKRDGDSNRAVPIMRDEDDAALATWETEAEAKAFASENLLCQVSETIFVDLDTYEVL